MSNYKLFNGDCLEVMKQIPDKSVDISFTSPPIIEKEMINIHSTMIQ